MHTLQYLATTVDLDDFDDTPTEDEIKKQAFDNVRTYLDTMYDEVNGVGGWSDWYSVGGGRWHSKSSETSFLDPEDETDVIVYNDDNACSFLETLDGIDEAQRREFDDLYNNINIDGVVSLLKKYSSGERVEPEEVYLTRVHYLSSALKIIQGYWNYNSYFLDTDGDTTDTAFTRKMLGIDKSQFNKVYCLVPVDFHF